MRYIRELLLAFCSLTSLSASAAPPSSETEAAYTLWDDEAYAGACRRFQTLVRGPESDPWAWRGLGLCAKRERAWRRALSIVSTVEPSTARAEFGMGLLGLATNGADPVPALQRATELDPRLCLAWISLGEAKSAFEDHDGADAAWATALECANIGADPWAGAITRYKRAMAWAKRGVALETVFAELSLAQSGFAASHPSYVPDVFIDRGDIAAAASRDDLAVLDWKKAGDLYSLAEDEPGLADSLLRLGEAFNRALRFEEAVDSCTAAAVLYTRNRWPIPAGDSWLCVGHAQQSGDPAAALVAFGKAERLFSRRFDSDREGDALVGRGDALLRLPSKRAPLRAFRAAKRVYGPEVDAIRRANLGRGLGDALMRLADYEGARAAFTWSLSGGDSPEEELGDGNAHLRLSRISLIERDPEEALAGLARAKESYARCAKSSYAGCEGVREDANMAFQEARARALQGRWTDAEAAYVKARDAYQEEKDERMTGHSWVGIGDSARALGRDSDATTAYKESLAGLRLPQDGDILGMAHFGQGVLFAANARMGDALESFQRARIAYRVAGDRGGEAEAQLAEGGILARQPGGSAQAHRALLRAARLARGAAWAELGGFAWLEEGHLRFREGRPRRALRAYRKAAQIAGEEGDQRLRANADVDQGEVWQFLGDRERAGRLFAAAEADYEAKLPDFGKARAFTGSADALLHAGDFGAAREKYREARVAFLAAKDRFEVGNTWEGEAETWFREGDTEQALACLRTARELFSAASDTDGVARTWLLEGTLLSGLYEHQRAADAFSEARDRFEAMKNVSGAADAWDGLAGVLSDSGVVEEALAAERRAARLYARAGHRQGVANALWGRGNILFQDDRLAAALGMFRRSRRLSDSVENEIGVGISRLGEAMVLAKLGLHRDAASAASEAAERMKSVPANRVQALVMQTKALAALGRDEEAAAAATTAIDTYRAWRGSGRGRRDRVARGATVSRAFEILAKVRAEGGNVEAALEVAEGARANVLLDSIQKGARSASHIPHDELVAERTRLRAELAQLGVPAADPVAAAEERLRRADLERALHWNEQDLLTAAGGELLGVGTPLTASEIHALADAVGPLLLMYSTQEEVLTFLVLPGVRDVGHASCPLTPNMLAASIVEFQAALATGGDEAGPGAALWTCLFAPMSDALAPYDRLIILPSGGLHALPFAALPVGNGSVLGDRWVVAEAPSVSVLSAIRARSVTGPAEVPRLTLVGPAMADLPDEVVARWGPHVQRDVTLTEYGALAPSAETLVLFTRGVAAPGGALDSWLVVAGDEGGQGSETRLKSAEIAAIPLPRARLVVLAACESSAGQMMLADERFDLARGFLQAGASVVIATLWKVPSAEAATFVDFLLEADASGLSPDQALATAQRRARTAGLPAAVWAAWTVIGAP